MHSILFEKNKIIYNEQVIVSKNSYLITKRKMVHICEKLKYYTHFCTKNYTFVKHAIEYLSI